MKIYLFFFISSIITLNCIESDFNVIDVKTNPEEKDYMDSLDDIYIEIDLSFGSNNDKFTLLLDLFNYCTAVPGIEFNKQNIKKFDKASSKTFNEIKEKPKFFYEAVSSGIIGEDTIKIGESESVHNMKFIVGYDYSFSTKLYTYTYFGLNLETEDADLKGLNIIEQLKNNSVINKQLWYLEFNNYNKGKFVIGKYPHEVNVNKYSENNLFSTNFHKSSILGHIYGIGFDDIYYGNINNYDNRTSMKIHLTSTISLTSRLIVSTYEFGSFIEKEFFRKKIDDKICFIKYINENSKYNYYYCDKNKVNISEMNNLNFYIRDNNMTFIFEPKDLFYEHNNYLYYLIIFKDYNDDDTDKDFNWELGLTFLQKYTFIFDRNDKLIYYYSSVNNGNNNDDNNNNNNNNNNGDNTNENNTNLKYIIIIVVLSLVFIGCIILLVIYIIKIKPIRKKKANELDEGYEYETKNNDENGEHLIND